MQGASERAEENKGEKLLAASFWLWALFLGGFLRGELWVMAIDIPAIHAPK